MNLRIGDISPSIKSGIRRAWEVTKLFYLRQAALCALSPFYCAEVAGKPVRVPDLAHTQIYASSILACATILDALYKSARARLYGEQSSLRGCCSTRSLPAGCRRKAKHLLILVRC